jgi:hypothetical protein
MDGMHTFLPLSGPSNQYRTFKRVNVGGASRSKVRTLPWGKVTYAPPG